MKKSYIKVICVTLCLILTSGCNINSKSKNTDELMSMIHVTQNEKESADTPAPTKTNEAKIDKLNAQELEAGLAVMSEPEKYSYDDMLADIDFLKKEYDDINIETLGITADNRKIIDIIIGEAENQNQILIIGSMHAREYITTQIVMR